MYSMCVKAAGLRVVQAHDGSIGLDRALKSQPDLLVTDIVMPGIDGFELTRRLREPERLEGLPVIAVTAHPVTEADVTRLQFGGPTSILMKPCEPIRLLVEIWKLLHDSQTLRARATAIIERASIASVRAVEEYQKSLVHHERSLTLVTSRHLRESDRIREGFLELPDLIVTPSDAAFRWSIDEASCKQLLNSMVADGFLIRSRGRYRRP